MKKFANADKYISKVNLSDTTYKIKDNEAREDIEILKDQKEDKNMLNDLAVSFCLLDGSMDDFTFVARSSAWNPPKQDGDAISVAQVFKAEQAGTVLQIS